QAAQGRIQGRVHEAPAQVRTLGDLRPLHAVRCESGLRRSHALSRSAHLDGATGQGDVGRVGGMSENRDASSVQALITSHEHAPMAADLFAYRKAPELSTGRSGDYPVIVIGAGPVGLCAAIDLALHGVECVLLDEGASVSEGSRAICFSKR